jgi:hypothetical protein
VHRWENDDRWVWPSESTPQRVTVRPSRATGDDVTEGSSKRHGQTSESERDYERTLHLLVGSFWVKKMSRVYLG